MPHLPPSTRAAPAGGPRTAWLMLVALTSGFALSQAYRTVAAIMATSLQAEFGLSPQALGVFAGSFHFAFGAMQLFMGIGIDVYGVRRTVLAAFPLAVCGAALSALAPHYQALLWGQVLIGVGCAPAFLVCTVFIARQFAASRFAQVSGVSMALGTLGMLFTGTPLAWLVQHLSWRAGFAVLGGVSALAWLGIFRAVQEPAAPAGPAGPAGAPRESLAQAIARFGALFLLPHTWGIVVLGSVTYAAFISLRGLWLGPLLIERHGFSVVESGHVALAVSVVSLCGPLIFGRIDPGPATRRRWIVACTLAVAALFLGFALAERTWVDVAGALLVGVLSGYIILQYADVRAAYPAALTGRAMAVFTMAMFLGVAAMQWLTGWIATRAHALGADPFLAVMGTIAAMLLLAAIAFRVLPGPPPAQREGV